jgi:hypothetical protein
MDIGTFFAILSLSLGIGTVLALFQGWHEDYKNRGKKYEYDASDSCM